MVCRRSESQAVEETCFICFSLGCLPIASSLGVAQQTRDVFTVEGDARRIMRRSLKQGICVHKILSSLGRTEDGGGVGASLGFFRGASMLAGCVHGEAWVQAAAFGGFGNFCGQSLEGYLH